jgi:hypothetical protein
VISPERLADLGRSLASDKAMLWARPLIALPDGTVIAGNQRLLAARARVETDPGGVRQPERGRSADVGAEGQ